MICSTCPASGNSRSSTQSSWIILLIFLPPRRLMVPPIRAEGGTFLGSGMPALAAAAMASRVDFSSVSGKWTCFSSSPWTDSKSERNEDWESRRLLEMLAELESEGKPRSSPSIRKSSSSQFSTSSSTGGRAFRRKVESMAGAAAAAGAPESYAKLENSRREMGRRMCSWSQGGAHCKVEQATGRSDQ